MSEQERRIDAVFEGGGVKGIGLVGAISVIEENGYQFVNVAGTSAGAIVASLVAAGYQAAEVRQILMDLDFNRLIDPSLLGRIPLIGPAFEELTELGLYEGDYFENFMRDLLAKRGVKTF